MGQFSEKKAAELISSFVQSIGVNDEQGLLPFFQSWKSFVGTDLAAHSRIEDFRHGSLIVRVDHPAWLQRLHIDRDRIIARINRSFPSMGVKYLHFYVGTLESDQDTVQDTVENLRNDGDNGNAGVLDKDSAAGNNQMPNGAEATQYDAPPELKNRFEKLRKALEEKERADRQRDR